MGRILRRIVTEDLEEGVIIEEIVREADDADLGAEHPGGASDRGQTAEPTVPREPEPSAPSRKR